MRRVGGAPLIYIGYHVPPGPHPDFAAAQMLAQVLGEVEAGIGLIQRRGLTLAANRINGFAPV